MPHRRHLALALCLLLGCVTFLTGINWGLPSRDRDAFLFPGTQPWDAARIERDGGPWKPATAADADSDPLAPTTQPAVLNETPAQQAALLRRYRLFSAQPDEMVTFMSLAGMRGGSLDPRMYQYGGLWIYPVGGLLKIGSLLGLVDLRPSLSYYLDHPDAFARFYLVARAYSAAWGLVGVWAVFSITRRFVPNALVPAAAAACFACMPVVINGAHEAKPHLAGAVLTLLAIRAATKYVDTGARNWALITGALCGAATGMVLSAAVSFVVIPVMALLRDRGARIRTAIVSTLVGVAVYCLTNPYVPLNLLRNPAVVQQNLGALSQAKALTGQSNDLGTFANARRLLADGATVVGGVVGLIALLPAVIARHWWRARRHLIAPALLLAAPAALVLFQFTLLAKGKPGEFARFATLPDVALVIAAVVCVAVMRYGRLWPVPMMLSLILLAAFQGSAYVLAFHEDATAPTATRRQAAARLRALHDAGARTLGVRVEPAPYSLPPLDLTGWRIILLPPGVQLPDADMPDVIVAAIDSAGETQGIPPSPPYNREAIWGQLPHTKTRLSWANKPFEILIRPNRPTPP